MRESNQEPKDFRRAIEDARTKWEDAVNMDVIAGAGYYEVNFRIEPITASLVENHLTKRQGLKARVRSWT